MGEGVGRAGHEAFGAALRGALVKGQQQEDYLPAGVSVRSANRSSPRASPASSSSLSTGLSSPITSPSLYSPVPFHDLASNGSFRPKSTTSSRPPTTSSNTSSSSTNRRASHGSSTAHPNPTVASEGLGLPAALTVLDLEIRNASLLALNTTLEVTRLRQTREISDLRRRLRESRSLAPISASVPNEGLLSGSESDGEDDPDDPDHPDAEDEEAAWEDVLQHDAKFAQAAGLLEALVRRAKDALAFHPSAVGRVLNQAELLDTGDSSAAPSPAPASVAGDDDDSDED
ncbi:hypothetical protein RQP46_010683 [Phenoliferia psychrophenolica]